LVLLFGRRISSPRQILFRLPAHLSPIHRFGVAVRPAHLTAAPNSLSFGRRIRRRSAYLVLFRLAGAPSRHRFGVETFGRRITRQAATDLVLFQLAGAFPDDLVSSFAGAFAANPPIWCCSIWLAHPLAVPPLPV
jgi:hypothetical protein